MPGTIARKPPDTPPLAGKPAKNENSPDNSWRPQVLSNEIHWFTTELE